jgi:hypothetical protein
MPDRPREIDERWAVAMRSAEVLDEIAKALSMGSYIASSPSTAVPEWSVSSDSTIPSAGVCAVVENVAEGCEA